MPLRERLRELADDLRFLIESRDEAYVYWIERRGRGCFLQATPIDVSSHPRRTPLLQGRHRRPHLRDPGRGGQLRFHASAGSACAARANPHRAGHFDYQKQALLYVPQHLPDPRSPGFAAAAAEEIERLLELSRGRAFVLFTSYQQMRQVYDRVASTSSIPTLMQGTGAARRPARGVPRHAPLRPVRDLVVLAGRGRAGRAAQPCYHR